MRRADRLFQIVQQLRRRRVTTAAQLAARLEVSERTIYRDIDDLAASGVPIEGEAGVGYRLGKDFDLPPLMLTVAEVEALVLGARMVSAWGDKDLQTAADSLLDKVRAVVPRRERERMDDTALFSLSFRVTDALRTQLREARRAVDERRLLRFAYRDAQGASSTRTVRPLGLYFWGNTWTLAAWCELRQGFRNFRVDRLESVEVTAETFELAPPITLDDFVRAMNEAEEGRP